MGNLRDALSACWSGTKRGFDVACSGASTAVQKSWDGISWLTRKVYDPSSSRLAIGIAQGGMILSVLPSFLDLAQVPFWPNVGVTTIVTLGGGIYFAVTSRDEHTAKKYELVFEQVITFATTGPLTRQAVLGFLERFGGVVLSESAELGAGIPLYIGGGMLGAYLQARAVRTSAGRPPTEATKLERGLLATGDFVNAFGVQRAAVTFSRNIQPQGQFPPLYIDGTTLAIVVLALGVAKTAIRESNISDEQKENADVAYSTLINFSQNTLLAIDLTGSIVSARVGENFPNAYYAAVFSGAVLAPSFATIEARPWTKDFSGTQTVGEIVVDGGNRLIVCLTPIASQARATATAGCEAVSSSVATCLDRLRDCGRTRGPLAEPLMRPSDVEQGAGRRLFGCCPPWRLLHSNGPAARAGAELSTPGIERTARSTS